MKGQLQKRSKFVIVIVKRMEISGYYRIRFLKFLEDINMDVKEMGRVSVNI